MKKTKIVNKSGFILVETLIVGVFIMGIFSLLYTNFFPLIGEYERYKDYDTVESAYVAHWGRMVALKGLTDSSYNTAKNTGYIDISDCSLYTNSDAVADCSSFMTMNNISKIYLTPYSTVELKNYVKDNTSFSRSFREYISYLPTYSKNTSKTADSGYYRIIIEYISDNTYRYGNIELYRDADREEETPDPGEDESSIISDVLIDDPGPNGSTYDDGDDTFITGTDPNNYIWYSGKLWRGVSVNNSAKTTKLITQWAITSLTNKGDSEDFKDNHMEEWLNDTSADGFLGNLRNYENFIVTDAKWNANLVFPATDKPTGTKIVTDAVGLLNSYEYTVSYRNATAETGYLNNGLKWWTLTPAASVRLYAVNVYGYLVSTESNLTYGVRPSINLKSNIKVVSGDGTIDNPYRLEGDYDTNLSGTRLNTRYSGEYVRFGKDPNSLYQIVSHEASGLTKITIAEPLKGNIYFKSVAFGDNVTYSSTNTMGTFLNGEYLTSYVGTPYTNMIEDNTTWYLGTVANGESYRLGKYTSANGNTLTSNRTKAKVGLLRFGELMAGQFNRYGNNAYYWLLTPRTSSSLRDVTEAFEQFADDPSSEKGIKPALNLKSNVIITGGDGTINNPFTLGLE